MVRLMHSMVRYNALRKSTKWDQARFGIPIPQVEELLDDLQVPQRTGRMPMGWVLAVVKSADAPAAACHHSHPAR